MEKVKFKNGWIQFAEYRPINLNVAKSIDTDQDGQGFYLQISWMGDDCSNFKFEHQEDRDRVYNEILAHLFGEGEVL